MKFAICQELFEDWDWERQCRLIKEIGYTGIEAAPFALAARITDLSQDRRAELRRIAEDQGLRIIGLHWLLAKTEGLHLTSADAAVRKATCEYLIELGNACADLGGDLLVFGSPDQRNVEAGMPVDAAFENAADVFRGALPLLAERGVTICMEPLTTKETNFITTCAEATRLIEMIGTSTTWPRRTDKSSRMFATRPGSSMPWRRNSDAVSCIKAFGISALSLTSVHCPHAALEPARERRPLAGVEFASHDRQQCSQAGRLSLRTVL
ncbi:MAG: sugar phosphate isomerase/epimerase [Planctomycetes bacterium]|nr:sugar phosphate isomerase/epimerase [Planctomycetota bacterium]